MSTDIESLLANALNPLHRQMLISILLKEALASQYLDQKSTIEGIDLPYSNTFEFEEFPRSNLGKLVYPSIEMAGVAGQYEYLKSIGLTVIFANDLSMDIHGIDAVAYDQKENKYTICESKGTALENFKTPSYYLKKTKRKGRQLSQRWCWVSLLEFANLATTADLFLTLLEHFLAGKVGRILTVTRLESVDNGFMIDEIRAWHDSEIPLSWFQAKHDLDQDRFYLKQIKEKIDFN